MRRATKSGRHLVAAGVVLIGLIGGLVAPVMAANETVALPELSSGLGLGFEPRSITSAQDGTMSTNGHILRMRNHRPVTLAIDMENSSLPPESEVSLSPNTLQVGEPDLASIDLEQTFLITIKIPPQTSPGIYKIWVKADDGILSEINVVLLTVEGVK